MLFKNREQIINNGQTDELKKIRKETLDILTSASNTVDPYNAVKTKIKDNQFFLDADIIDISNFKNIYLVGFGKASIGMANAILDSIEIKKGVVITNDADSKIKNNFITTIHGSHPIPNKNSMIGAEKILELVKECKEEDLLIVLISGGGSSLFCKPRVGLEDLQLTTNLLLRSGANINEINTIRKHLSFVKGGQLAKAAKCTTISLIISDIVGDPLEFIASGPTYPDSTTYDGAKKIFEKYELWDKTPISIKETIQNGIKGDIPETAKNDDPVFKNVYNYIIANNKIACKAAENKAKELGYQTMILTTSLDGEAKEVSKFLVDRALNYTSDAKKIVFISGGETTVNIRGHGKGGRNQEMVLSSVEKLAGKNIVFASFATDGIDGDSDSAGAIADTFSLNRAIDNNLKPEIFLDENNSYDFFKKLDDIFLTGPTGTNVMDLQLIIKI